MPQILRRQILDQILDARSSKSAYLKDLETVYLRFPIPDAHAPATILLSISSQEVCAFLPEGGHAICQPLLGEPLRSWQIKTMANRLLLAEIRRDYDVFHGCAVESAAGAILLIGGSGTGKSTLVLELVKSDYPLLCEGQIPIERATALVKPFPRGFELFPEKPGTASAAGFRSDAKRIVPATPVHSSTDCALHAIVFLQGLFPGISPQKIELGCPPEEQEMFIEFLADRGAYEINAETRERRTIIGCRFDPGAGNGLDELSRALSECQLNPSFLSCAPTIPPDWNRPMVASAISKTMATLGMAANTSLTARRSPDAESGLGRLARFSRYTGQAQAFLLVNGFIDERRQWIENRFPTK